MKLLFLYIKKYRSFVERQMNFDADERFVFENGTLSRRATDPLPSGFFNLKPGQDRGCVSSVSMVLGENGSGKTSLAAILDEIFSNPRTEQLEYVCVYRLFADGGSTLYCLNNLKDDLGFEQGLRDEAARKTFICWELKSGSGLEKMPRPRLVYASPFYAFRPSIFRVRTDQEPSSTTVDLSATRYVNEAIVSEPETKGRMPRGLVRLANLQREEIARVLDFATEFSKRQFRYPDVELPMPAPDVVTVSMNGDFIAATIQALVSARKTAGLEAAVWLKDAEKSFDYARNPDLLLQLISIWQGDNLSFYAAQREIRGSYAYNDKWVEYGLEMSKRIRQVCQKRSWDDIAPKERDALKSQALDLLVEMFAEFPKQSEEHVRRVRLLQMIEEKVAEPDSELTGATAEEGPVVLGQVLSLSFKLNNEEDRKLLYGVLGSFYASQNGQYALDVEFGNFSSGEMSYLSLFARLYSALKSGGEEVGPDSVEADPHILIYLDEAETTLHPAWQRKLVYNLVWFVESFMQGHTVHLVFASHSPMLLSDIPKLNVVMMDSRYGGKDENDSIRAGFDILPNTFGANVFDLYRLPFGMSDGVMGLWAKRKLDRLVGLISRKERFSGDDVKLAKLFGNRFIHGYLEKWYETHIA